MINILFLFIALSASGFAEPIRIDDSSIAKHVNALSKIGNLGPSPKDGFNRRAWSNEETRAMEYIKAEGVKIGLKPRYDSIGNLFLDTDASAKEIVQIGSHLDTVPAGGNFDGAAGIISGLEAIQSLMKKGLPKGKGLELVVWRGEEAASFGVANKGSKLAFGEKIPVSKELEEAIKQQGFSPSPIKMDTSKIVTHFELNIEQGIKLQTDAKDIGIVTSIRGSERYMIKVSGRFDHSGATPMGTKYRHDVNLAIAYTQVELDKLIQSYLNKGYDLVQTIGVVNSDKGINEKNPLVYNNALTKVSGFGYFILDIRSNSKKQRDEYAKKALETIKAITDKYKTRVEIIHVSDSPSTETLNVDLEHKIEAAAKLLDYKYEYLGSGAGHDAAIVAKHKIRTAMIFVPCKDGISHSKEEFTKISDIRKGAEVLANAIWLLIKEPEEP
jgi:N-carbamoyl-L-amino-acid hydrolase